MLDVETSVLISIKPHYCAQIFDGKKNVELRKTMPKLPTPFRAYVYCTAPKQRLIDIIRPGDDVYGDTYKGEHPIFIKAPDVTAYWIPEKQVVGEVVIDRIAELTQREDQKVLWGGEPATGLYAHVTQKQFTKYKGDGKLYGWRISEHTLYDKPISLKWFDLKQKPPQSWQYVYVDRSDAIRLHDFKGTKEDEARTRVVLD